MIQLKILKIITIEEYKKVVGETEYPHMVDKCSEEADTVIYLPRTRCHYFIKHNIVFCKLEPTIKEELRNGKFLTAFLMSGDPSLAWYIGKKKDRTSETKIIQL